MAEDLEAVRAVRAVEVDSKADLEAEGGAGVEPN